jgi:hypothetical protein
MELYKQLKGLSRFKMVVLASFLFLAISFCSNPGHDTNAKSGMVGYWSSDSTSARLVFFYDKTDTLRLVEWDDGDGEEMEILEFNVTDGQVKTTERMPSTDHVIHNTYILKDENTIENTFTGDDSSTMIFKRLL